MSGKDKPWLKSIPEGMLGLADIMKPIIEMGAGVMEDALAYQALLDKRRKARNLRAPARTKKRRSALPWSVRRARNQLAKRGMCPESIQRWLDLHERKVFSRKYIRTSRDEPWVPRNYQVESLESYAPRKVHCDGRDVGKTSEIEIIAAWAMVACPNSEMLIATQCENHLFPLMHRIVRRFTSTTEFAASLVELKRSPSWYLRFSNGFQLWGRIAGPHGMNFQGLHVQWQVVDEAQEVTETAWAEMHQALNSGGCRWIYGVPNGLRNTFYRMTQMQDAKQCNWPSSLNPDFTPEKDAELALLYGGRDSPGYIHRVLGQHGSPDHAVFDLDDYLACVDKGVDFASIAIGEKDRFEAPGPVEPGDYYLGCDLGYVRDPSEFMVYRSSPPHLINVLRVRLRGVNYAKQQDVIVELDRAYQFRSIGIDCGNSGRAVAHALMARGEEWCAKVRTFEFGSAIDLEPLPDGSPCRRRVKQFMTELIERCMAERTIVFPHLADRESQYASHTYSVNNSGEIIYQKGEDHIIDADRCALLAHHLDTRGPDPALDLGVRAETFWCND